MAALLLFAVLTAGRDPFAPDGEPPDIDVLCEQALCRYKLDELKLVAIVSGDALPVAMFETPRGKGLLARRGSRIGKRGGRVVDISRRCVTLYEQREKRDLCIAEPPITAEDIQRRSSAERSPSR